MLDKFFRPLFYQSEGLSAASSLPPSLPHPDFGCVWHWDPQLRRQCSCDTLHARTPARCGVASAGLLIPPPNCSLFSSLHVCTDYYKLPQAGGIVAQCRALSDALSPAALRGLLSLKVVITVNLIKFACRKQHWKAA